MRSTSRQSPGCVLLPTDFQQPARRAFSYGIALARLLGARLDILHVIKSVADASRPPPDSRYLQSLKTSALLNLGRLARMAKEAGVQAAPRLEYGAPDACILEAVDTTLPRVIVMGTEGREGWDRLRLGSTAERVIRQAPCPVLAVHGGLGSGLAHRPARVKLARWLVATDFSPAAEAARRVVSRLARLSHAKVCIVHVVGKESATRVGLWKLNRLAAALRRQDLDLEGLCVTGDPIEAILHHAARWEADVIVVGTKGRSGLARVVLGSVAEGLLRRAGFPVLVVKHAAPFVRGEDRQKQRS
jgi:nucleotide-binding universal stress UspA family protein